MSFFGIGKTGSSIPADVMEYKGAWNANTNSPILSDATGTLGYIYRVSIGGTQNLGSGAITFLAGDLIIHNGSIWQQVQGPDTELDPLSIHLNGDNSPSANIDWGNKEITDCASIHLGLGGGHLDGETVSSNYKIYQNIDTPLAGTNNLYAVKGNTGYLYLGWFNNSVPYGFSLFANGGDLWLLSDTIIHANPTTDLYLTPGGTTPLINNKATFAQSDVVTGNGKMALDRTNGFLYIPVMDGTPTGTPAAYNGLAGGFDAVYPIKASITDGDYVWFRDTNLVLWAVALDTTGTAANTPTGGTWPGIAVSNKIYLDISALVTAAQVATAVKNAFNALVGFSNYTTLDDSSADGHLIATDIEHRSRSGSSVGQSLSAVGGSSSVPATFTDGSLGGQVPIVFNSNDNKIYVYSGGSWHAIG